MERRNVSISGTGKIGGGEYGNVRISGAGKVDGDLVAEEIRISGSGKILGSAKAKEISVSGAARFGGRVEGEVFQASGACVVEGELQTGELRCSGSQKVGGPLKAHYIRSSGTLSVGGNVDTDVFTSSGRFSINGMLSADRVEVRLVGNSTVKEIGGEHIEVRSGGGFNFQVSLSRGFRMGFAGGSLTAEVIEGDEVYLEETQADIVRGVNVKIGPGCKIKRVEYQNSLEVHSDAQVNEKSKV